LDGSIASRGIDGLKRHEQRRVFTMSRVLDQETKKPRNTSRGSDDAAQRNTQVQWPRIVANTAHT
jgi:hypothetical protein